MNEVSKAPKSKETSFEYGTDYQAEMVEKYKNRNNNHWKQRIELAHQLIEKYALLKHLEKPKKDIVVVDIGCSVGTFAIEFAKLGYKSFGIDFDIAAIDTAKQLAVEENVTPEFVCGDVSEWSANFPPIDIAICFDIFEHLHDDELGSFLAAIRKQLSGKGALVFHTFPTKYSHIFHGRGYVTYPLLMFKNMSQSIFNKIVKAYDCFLDIVLLAKTGETYQEKIGEMAHCNPVSSEKLTDILKRAGYEIVFMDMSYLYDTSPTVQKQFKNQPISFPNLYGVATPKQKM